MGGDFDHYKMQSGRKGRSWAPIVRELANLRKILRENNIEAPKPMALTADNIWSPEKEGGHDQGQEGGDEQGQEGGDEEGQQSQAEEDKSARKKRKRKTPTQASNSKPKNTQERQAKKGKN